MFCGSICLKVNLCFAVHFSQIKTLNDIKDHLITITIQIRSYLRRATAAPSGDVKLLWTPHPMHLPWLYFFFFFCFIRGRISFPLGRPKWKRRHFPKRISQSNTRVARFIYYSCSVHEFSCRLRQGQRVRPKGTFAAQRATWTLGPGEYCHELWAKWTMVWATCLTAAILDGLRCFGSGGLLLPN